MTTTLLERRRTFTGGGPDLDAPVDTLGRMRHRAVLDRRDVLRADGDDATSRRFVGHAAVFNKRTLIGGKRWGFWESIAPGSFAKTIGETDVRFLVNHDPNLLLARNRAGTLDLAEDGAGLATGADLDTRQSYTSDLVISLERGDVSQMSFAFEPIAWRHEEAEDGKPHYVMTEVRLWDVSVVTYPAYEDTDAGLRAAGFAALVRSLGLDETDLLEQLGRADVPDLRAYLDDKISARSGGADQPGPRESTREPEAGPRESTRHDRPPADATGTRTDPADEQRFDRLREHRFADLARTLENERGR